MLQAIFSDVHGNYDALARFYDETKNVEKYFCLGDIVHAGKSFEENRCIDLIKSKKTIVVQGNHEEEILENNPVKGKILLHNLEYLAGLPTELVVEQKYHLIHAPLNKRIFDVDSTKEYFSKMSPKIEICFFGHSHQQIVYSKNKKGKIKEEMLTKRGLFLRPDLVYMVNPGALGLYFNENRTYLLFDDKSKELQFMKMN